MSMQWWRRSTRHKGVVFRRDAMNPETAQRRLGESGWTTSRVAPVDASIAWRLTAHHAAFGPATIDCPVASHGPSERFIKLHQGELTETEARFATTATAYLDVALDGLGNHVLVDRKSLLRILDALFDPQSVVAYDATAKRFWSRGALEDELAHDAPLSLFSTLAIHAVGDGQRASPIWLHTHGIQDLGAPDIEILGASLDMLRQRESLVLAVVGAVLEGTLKPGGPPVSLVRDWPPLGAVGLSEFLDRASHPSAQERRAAHDPDHDGQRIVITDAPADGRISRLFGQRPSPYAEFTRAIPEHLVFALSPGISRLREERARLTYGQLVALRREFGEANTTALIKLGCPTGNGPHAREHLWFEALAMTHRTIEARLLSTQPNDAGLAPGSVGTFDTSLLSDWELRTAEGIVSPQSTAVARRLREWRPAH